MRINRLCAFLAAVAVAGVASSASAQTLDGSISGDGYSLFSVQTLQTGFGDANPNGGSELNAAWGSISGGVLHLTLTGNLENNFNKLNLFFDTVAGGENTITSDINNGGNNPANDGWAGKYAGFTFDAGFAADFMMIARNGNDGSIDRFDFDFSSVGNAGLVQSSANIFLGSQQGSNANVGASGIGVAFNNSNTAGVTGGSDAADQTAAMAVQTGLELFIPLAAIGNPGEGDLIRIVAHINGSNHDFLSNQSLAGYGAPQGNLGGDGNGTFTGTLSQIDLNNFAGLQYFTITVPEPGALGLLGLGALALLRRRR